MLLPGEGSVEQETDKTDWCGVSSDGDTILVYCDEVRAECGNKAVYL